MEAIHVAVLDAPNITSISSQDDRNPYKASLAEKLAAIKAARVSNDSSTVLSKGEKIPSRVSNNNIENNPLYDF